MAISTAKQTFVSAFMEGLTQPSSEWMEGFDVMTDDVPAMTLASLSGVGNVPVWAGNVDIDTTDVNDRYNTSLAYTKYALQIRLNKYDVKDVPNLVRDAGIKLGVAIANTYGSIAATILEDTFDATTSAGDGVALCANNHPTNSGANRDNLTTSAFDRTAWMSNINLASLWVSFHNQEEDWSGDPMVFYGSPQDTTLREVSTEVWGSGVSSSEMQTNAARGYAPENAVIWQKLTDSTRWWMVSKLRKPLVFWIRSAAESNTTIDEDSRQTKITTDFAIGTTAKPDPVGIIGNDAA